MWKWSVRGPCIPNLGHQGACQPLCGTPHKTVCSYSPPPCCPVVDGEETPTPWSSARGPAEGNKTCLKREDQMFLCPVFFPVQEPRRSADSSVIELLGLFSLQGSQGITQHRPLMCADSQCLASVFYGVCWDDMAPFQPGVPHTLWYSVGLEKGSEIFLNNTPK